MFKRKEFLTVFIIQVTEVLGFSLILPYLPFMAEEFGASPLVIGLIGTTFSIFQFFSAPILGRLSDIYGRKPIFLVSQASTLLGFIVLGFANSLFLIFLSRIIDGLLGSNFTVAQAYLADISTDEERSVAFGISGVAFGVGFLIGPALGGFLASFGYSLPAFIAAAVTLGTIIITQTQLKETVDIDVNKKFNIRDINLFNLEDFKKYTLNPRIAPIMWAFFLYILAHMIYVSNFAIFGNRQLGLNVSNIGFLLAYVGLSNILLRGFLLERLINRFSEQFLEKIGFISMMIGLVSAGFIRNPYLFLICITFFSFGTGVLRPILLGGISRAVSKKEQGSLFGVNSALSSLTQISGPIISGFLLTYFFPGLMPFVAAFISFLGFVLISKKNLSLT